MSELQSAKKPAPTSFHWPSLIQLIFSLLASLILFGGATFIALSALLSNDGAASRDPTEAFMVAASLAFAGVLVLPSAWFAWRYISFPERESVPRPKPRRVGLILTILVIILVGGALWLGNWSAQNNYLTWLFLPPLNIIATGLPALWLIYIGTRGLIPGAPRRKWGVFATGLVLGPVIILVLELTLLLIIGIIALIWIMLNPDLANLLNGLVYRLQNAGSNFETILSLLAPFLLNPGIIFLIFTFISVLVPLLEEALKPIGVWFMAGQKLTPAQGFAYGILSGAGFGLFENLGNTSGGTADWAILAATRTSTLLLHCFTAGLLGWALVLAWREKRYLRLAITYAIAVIIHGLWNGLALLQVASSLPTITNTPLPSYLQMLGPVSVFSIIALGVIVFILYIGANYVFQRSNQAPSSPPTVNAQQSFGLEEHPALLPDKPFQSSSDLSEGDPSSTGNEPLGPKDESANQHLGNNSTITG